MEATKNYSKDGHAVLKRLASPAVLSFYLASIQSDMGHDVDTLNKFKGRHDMLGGKETYELYGYHYRPLLFFQWGLTPLIEHATGKTLLPTYAYFRVYSKDAICKIHSDRYSSQHSITMSLGYGDDVLWPLTIGRRRLKDDEVQALPPSDDYGDEPYEVVDLNPGDGLLYQGTHFRHGRLAPNPNRWSAHCFMHWVEEGGPYSEYAFDKWKIPNKADFPF